ncbi:unnamed protein product [Phytophthora fragariaefolia]|uniref:Unnamed protein product n=1 Tax=Phytophthora fragariaefolia TaxID=1490495 RepID=A0A9W6XI15_9STRA|nr:unnamed protein product [Phytophthora fragariaefolia]
MNGDHTACGPPESLLPALLGGWGKVQPRPFGEAFHATRPNEVLHFDYLSLPTSSHGTKDVLVLKDDMSGFVELVECSAATASETADALLAWFKRFGVVTQWVSDRGPTLRMSGGRQSPAAPVSQGASKRAEATSTRLANCASGGIVRPQPYAV